jgi:hypothetical protein
LPDAEGWSTPADRGWSTRAREAMGGAARSWCGPTQHQDVPASWRVHARVRGGCPSSPATPSIRPGQQRAARPVHRATGACRLVAGSERQRPSRSTLPEGWPHERAPGEGSRPVADHDRRRLSPCGARSPPCGRSSQRQAVGSTGWVDDPTPSNHAQSPTGSGDEPRRDIDTSVELAATRARRDRPGRGWCTRPQGRRSWVASRTRGAGPRGGAPLPDRGSGRTRFMGPRRWTGTRERHAGVGAARHRRVPENRVCEVRPGRRDDRCAIRAGIAAAGKGGPTGASPRSRRGRAERLERVALAGGRGAHDHATTCLYTATAW